MKKIIYVLLLIFLFISCSEQTAVIKNSGDTDTEAFYRIETEPSLSYDRSTILMVRADTQVTAYNGIYSAKVTNPIRNLELLGDNITSPTLAVNREMIVFLKNYKLFIFDKISDSVYQFSSDQLFQKLVFINDSVLEAVYNSSLLLIDSLSSNSFSIIAEGLLPTIYIDDTIAYLESMNSDAYVINLMSMSKFANESVFVTIPIDTIFSGSLLSFGIEPQLRRYCYSVKNGKKYDIYAGGSGNEADHLVAESDFSGVVMLDFNTIIYTGDDGRLYRTDFLGENSYPFWAALDSQE